MNKKKQKVDLIRKIQKELLLIEFKDAPDSQKNRVCYDFGTRACLTCSRCWIKEP